MHLSIKNNLIVIYHFSELRKIIDTAYRYSESKSGLYVLRIIVNISSDTTIYF